MRLFAISETASINEDTHRAREVTKLTFDKDRTYMASDYLTNAIGQFLGQKFTKNEALAPGLIREYKGENLDGKSLFINRGGGIGDAIFLTPSIMELKRLYPTCKIAVSTEDVYHTFLRIPEIDELLSICLPLDEILKYDYCILVENLIESNPRAELENAYDLHAEKFGLSLTNHQPKISVDPKERQRLERMPGWNRDRFNIVWQFTASVPKRSVNPELWFKFLSSFKLDNVHIWMCDAPGGSQHIRHFINSMRQVNPTLKLHNFADTTTDVSSIVALISMCDMVIGLDSSYVHIAGALQKPLIGLYGAFPSDLRIRYYKNAIGIDANSKCMFAENSKYKSCMEHGNEACRLAKIIGRNYAPCMELIEPSHLRSAFNNILQRVFGGTTLKSGSLRAV